MASIRDADALGQKIVFTLKKRFNFQRICLENQLTLAWRTYLPAITRRVSSSVLVSQLEMNIHVLAWVKLFEDARSSEANITLGRGFFEVVS